MIYYDGEARQNCIVPQENQTGNDICPHNKTQ